MSLKEYLSEYEAAQFLGLTPRTLQSWRLANAGPAFIYISKKIIRYKTADLVEWINGKRVASKASEAECLLPIRNEGSNG